MPRPSPMSSLMTPQRRRRQCPRCARGGFTLLELLVAMSIILLLGGLLLVGFNQVAGSAKNKQTRILLAQADAMLEDYKAAVGSTGLTEKIERSVVGGDFEYDLYEQTGATTFTEVDAPSDIGSPPGRIIAQLEVADSPADAMTDPTSGLIGDPDALPEDQVGVIGTFVALQRMKADTSVGQVLAAFPADSLRTVTVAQLSNTSGPLLLDAWQNPLILVPAGGLVGVRFEQHDTEPHRITSRGTVEPVAPTAGSWEAALPLAAVPAGAAPFWASAGADGNLATGDDNLYSFEAD